MEDPREEDRSAHSTPPEGQGAPRRSQTENSADPPPAIALFGGVFDPIHSGHVEIARLALDRLPITDVVFLPAGNPPHKSDRTAAPPQHRRAMLERAIAGEPHFQLDPRELDRPGPSYTVLTLLELAEERPGTTVYFLIGADNARTIGAWHRAEEIFHLSEPVVIARPGESVAFTAEDLPFLDEAARARVNARMIEGIALEQSSSAVRERVAAGLPLDNWVPTTVAEYIAEHGLYSEV